MGLYISVALKICGTNTGEISREHQTDPLLRVEKTETSLLPVTHFMVKSEVDNELISLLLVRTFQQRNIYRRPALFLNGGQQQKCAP